MAHSTEFPYPDGAQAATINGNFLVRRDLQGASLNLTTTDRGMQLTDVLTKWRALFHIRSRTQGNRSGSLTAEWFNVRTSLLLWRTSALLMKLYARIGVYGTIGTVRNRAGFSMKGVNHYTAVTKAQDLRIRQLQPAISRSLIWGQSP
jgi:hypothetical protein